MKNFTENFKKIYTDEKPLLMLMAGLFVISLALGIFTGVNLHTGASVTKVAYSDIGRYQGGEWTSMSNSGGYYDGSWVDLLAFPVLALVLGVVHNLLAVRLYEKKGSGIAQMFVLFSIGLALSTFVIFGRLIGEG